MNIESIIVEEIKANALYIFEAWNPHEQSLVVSEYQFKEVAASITKLIKERVEGLDRWSHNPHGLGMEVYEKGHWLVYSDLLALFKEEGGNDE